MIWNIWEQAVANYLTIDRGLFLNLQFVLDDQETTTRQQDFVAVAFPDNAVWVVGIIDETVLPWNTRIRSFDEKCASKIKELLLRHRVIQDHDSRAAWTVGLWLFASDPLLPQLAIRLRTAKVEWWRLTSLEETSVPDWKARFR